MLKQWFKEQWYDIKYAHKSLWASIVCIMLAASALVWMTQDYRYGRELAFRENYIKELTAQNQQLRALVNKYVPKQALQNTTHPSSDKSLVDQAQDKIDELQNNVNNAQTGVQGQVQQMDDKVNDAANNVNNSLVKMQTDNDTTYRKATQRAYEATH